MAHGEFSVSKSDVVSIVEAPPLKISSMARFVLISLMFIGLLAFVHELTNGDAKHAWTSFHVNFLYWFCIASAASCFSAVFHICNAQWSRPIARLFQSALPFMQWSPVILIVLYFGHGYLFDWAHHEIPGKGVWLTSGFLFTRNVLAVCFLAFLARKVICCTVRRDIAFIRSGATEADPEKAKRWQHKRYDGMTKDWGDDNAAALEESHLRMSRLSPLIVIFYAVIMSLVAFDLIMSVDPHWYSTMWGGYYFMSGVYMAMAWVAIGVALVRKYHPLYLTKVDRPVLHDLGKLLFGFGIFWAYLFWSHYLPIWYGNLPEETGFIIIRLRDEPWHSIAWMTLGCSFIIPFLLGLSRDVKQIPALLMATGTIAAIGGWLNIYIMFAPTLYPDVLPFNFTDLAITLGFMGAFLYSASSFLSKVPLIPFADLYHDH